MDHRGGCIRTCSDAKVYTRHPIHTTVHTNPLFWPVWAKPLQKGTRNVLETQKQASHLMIIISWDVLEHITMLKFPPDILFTPLFTPTPLFGPSDSSTAVRKQLLNAA